MKNCSLGVKQQSLTHYVLSGKVTNTNFKVFWLI